MGKAFRLEPFAPAAERRGDQVAANHAPERQPGVVHVHGQSCSTPGQSNGSQSLRTANLPRAKGCSGAPSGVKPRHSGTRPSSGNQARRAPMTAARCERHAADILHVAFYPALVARTARVHNEPAPAPVFEHQAPVPARHGRPVQYDHARPFRQFAVGCVVVRVRAPGHFRGLGRARRLGIRRPFAYRARCRRRARGPRDRQAH